MFTSDRDLSSIWSEIPKSRLRENEFDTVRSDVRVITTTALSLTVLNITLVRSVICCDGCDCSHSTDTGWLCVVVVKVRSMFCWNHCFESLVWTWLAEVDDTLVRECPGKHCRDLRSWQTTENIVNRFYHIYKQIKVTIRKFRQTS